MLVKLVLTTTVRTDLTRDNTLADRGHSPSLISLYSTRQKAVVAVTDVVVCLVEYFDGVVLGYFNWRW